MKKLSVASKAVYNIIGASLLFIAFCAQAGTPPSITTEPASITNSEGSTVQFTVVATGDGPLSYKWRFGTTTVQTGPS
jgi:hypothetical protein